MSPLPVSSKAPAASNKSVTEHLGISRSAPLLWGETWSLALQALRANKVRAMLTMLGVIIGSACIVLVVTVALAGKRYIISQIEGVGSNLIYGELEHTGDSQRTALADEVTVEDMDAVKEAFPEVAYAAGTHDLPMTVVIGGTVRPVNLVGVTSEFQQIRRLLVTQGRYFDQDDMVSRSKVCLLTPDLAKLAFPNENPIGKDMRLGDLHFTVIGVFRERTATFGETEITDFSAIVPYRLDSVLRRRTISSNFLRASRERRRRPQAYRADQSLPAKRATAPAPNIASKISLRCSIPLAKFPWRSPSFSSSSP